MKSFYTYLEDAYGERVSSMNKNINLLYCSSDNYNASGAFLCLVSLCKYLKEKFDINVKIILPRDGSGTQLLIDNNLQYKIIKSTDWVIPDDSSKSNKCNTFKTWSRNIRAIIKLIFLIKKEKIDIIHLNTIWTWVAAVAALHTKTPIVWHIREALKEGFDFKIGYNWGYDLINHSTKIISISEAVLSSYPKIDKEKSVVIYDGVDVSRYYNPTHEIFKEEKVLITCCGSIYKQKGQQDLIRACGELLKRGYRNWELKIYGIGEIDSLIPEIEKYGLVDYVSLEGYKSDIENYISLSDISVVPSHFEGFGRVTAEAMMSGCVVIASNSGANPEIISKNETGLLFEVKNSSDLCDKIIWAMNNREECRMIAKRGQRIAVEKFDAYKNAQGVYDVYQEILERVRCKNA